MGGGRSCSVIGCSYRSTTHRKCRFYQFPTDQTIRDIWITFTRRGSDFVIKSSSYICENHFHPSSFIVKKKQICLAKNTVPTIFYRTTPEGETEKVELTFDSDVMHYLEEETLLNPLFDRDKREQELIEKKQQKLEEVQRLCRFCLEDQNNENLIEIRKLRDYNISPAEVFELFGLKNIEFFSKSACEECFQQVFVFDGYRKRCKKAQDRIINDFKAIEEEIAELKGNELENSWLKTEENMDWDVIEEKLDESFESFKKSPGNQEIHEVIVKLENDGNENIENDIEDDFDVLEEYNDNGNPVNNETDSDWDPDYTETIIEPNLDQNLKMKIRKINKKEENKEIFAVAAEEAAEALKNLTKYGSEDDAVMENSELAKQPNKCTIYECFFCRIRFTGKKLYKTHDCPVKEFFCEIPTCNKKFTSISGFNSHLRKLHKLRTLKKHFCRYCKVSKITTLEEFNDHLAKCEAAAIKANDNPVTCEICAKICPNPKAFAIHMMFHKTGKKSFDVDASQPVTKFRKLTKGIFICETCGKEFSTTRYLVDHVNRMHKIEENCEKVFCDHCGKSYTSKYAVRKHIRCVHLVQLSPCSICGKVFRNVTLLKAHIKLLHDQSRRIHFCPLCPDKPPYNTAVALRRHQEASHGMGNGYNCDMCGNGYKTRSGLKQHKIAAHSVKTSNMIHQNMIHQNI